MSSKSGGTTTPKVAGRSHIRHQPLTARATAAFFLFFVIGLNGCTSVGGEGQAQRLGLHSSTVSGATFTHRIYRASDNALPSGARTPLIVLLDGDGQAFLTRTQVALDPTPSRSWLLASLPAVAEFGPAMYLGRPCYLDTMTQTCHPRYWTTHRYSEAVVTSLVAALNHATTDNRPLVLVGYSGGGTLAVLLAEQLGSRVVGLLTLAAPLDLAAWAQHHDYTPLTGSLGPNLQAVTTSPRCQQFLYGAKDAQVPVKLARRWHKSKATQIQVVSAKHACCWERPLAAALQQLLANCLDV